MKREISTNKNKVSSNIEFYYFIKVMKRYTDSLWSLKVSDISERIKSYIYNDLKIEIDDIDRRKIYNYLETMRELGYDIQTHNNKKYEYYLASPEFELKELKILVESVLANKFITNKQTKNIIDKLGELTTECNQESLTYKYDFEKRSKSQNHEVIDNIYTINKAIEEKKKIKFKQYTYTWDKRFVPRKNKKGEVEYYIANPMGVIIKNGRYYVILSMRKNNKVSVKNYRVDRMKKITVLDEKIDNFIDEKEYRKHLVLNKRNKLEFDIALYDKRNFKMYNGGEYGNVVVRIKETLINLFIDEIGIDYVDIKKLNIKDNNRIYEVSFEANISQGLKKWLISLGDEARVIYPLSLKEDLINFSKDTLDMYLEKEPNI